MPEPTPETWHDAGDAIDFRGHRIFVRSGGDPTAPALLLVHGFPTSSWDWHRIWDALAEDWRLITCDMLGFGLSDKPRRHRYSIFEQATLQEALLDEFDVDRCTILSHDYGDTVVQEMLARRLERAQTPGEGDALAEIDGVCMLNGGIFYEAIRPRPIQRLLRGPLGPAASMLMNRPLFGYSFSKLFSEAHQPTGDELDDFWDLIHYHDGHRVAHKINRYLDERQQHRDRWVGALQQTDVPLRLVCGLEDPVSGRSIAERWRELLPDRDLVRLESIGHYPQIEAPRETLEAFRSFTDKRPSETTRSTA